jgi:beta-glucosidase
VELAPGEEKDVTFELTTADLAFYTARGKWEAELGDFRVFVGTNSEDTKDATFTLR